jgi:dolichol-phosphate mannosyltransferase
MTTPSATQCEISVVIPVFNEAGNIGVLLEELTSALDGRSFELIVVDDGSSDHSIQILQALKPDLAGLRIVRHHQNAGQSRAIRSGALRANGKILCVLDGDGQNVPADLPALIDHLLQNPDLDMVGGERQKRQDSFSKRMGSRFANSIRQFVLGDQSVDTGCGLKAMRRETYLLLPYFDHQHRYMPALMQREGRKVAYLPVQHRARRSGVSKYSNWGRLLVAFRDLVGVKWLLARSRSAGKIDEL